MKITVYTTSDFMGNVVKYEGKLIEHGRMKYAQYDNAPFVTFIPKGKRNAVRILKGYNPYILVLAGWDYPEPESMCPANGGMSKYASFDAGWKRDFEEMLNTTPLMILADYREKSV